MTAPKEGMTQANVTLTVELWQEVKLMAVVQRTPLAEWVAEALKEKLDREKENLSK